MLLHVAKIPNGKNIQAGDVIAVKQGIVYN